MIRCRPKGALQKLFSWSLRHSRRGPTRKSRCPLAMIRRASKATSSRPAPWSRSRARRRCLPRARQSGATLSVDIEKDTATIHGAIPLDNLANAISYLQSNCSERWTINDVISRLIRWVVFAASRRPI
jgi:hypothetical protein